MPASCSFSMLPGFNGNANIHLLQLTFGNTLIVRSEISTQLLKIKENVTYLRYLSFSDPGALNELMPCIKFCLREWSNEVNFALRDFKRRSL